MQSRKLVFRLVKKSHGFSGEYDVLWSLLIHM